MNKIVKQIKPKLKPCPFCGGQASVLTRGGITFLQGVQNAMQQ